MGIKNVFTHDSDREQAFFFSLHGIRKENTTIFVKLDLIHIQQKCYQK